MEVGGGTPARRGTNLTQTDRQTLVVPTSPQNMTYLEEVFSPSSQNIRLPPRPPLTLRQQQYVALAASPGSGAQGRGCQPGPHLGSTWPHGGRRARQLSALGGGGGEKRGRICRLSGENLQAPDRLKLAPLPGQRAMPVRWQVEELICPGGQPPPRSWKPLSGARETFKGMEHHLQGHRHPGWWEGKGSLPIWRVHAEGPT